MNKTETELMQIDDVCAILHISRSTAYSMFKKGEIPGKKIGGKWQVPLTELETFLDQYFKK